MPKRVLSGIVVSDVADKTVVVLVRRRFTHPFVGKVVQREKRIMAHDVQNKYKLGDIIEIVETIPVSKKKRFKVIY